MAKRTTPGRASEGKRENSVNNPGRRSGTPARRSPSGNRKFSSSRSETNWQTDRPRKPKSFSDRNESRTFRAQPDRDQKTERPFSKDDTPREWPRKPRSFDKNTEGSSNREPRGRRQDDTPREWTRKPRSFDKNTAGSSNRESRGRRQDDAPREWTRKPRSFDKNDEGSSNQESRGRRQDETRPRREYSRPGKFRNEKSDSPSGFRSKTGGGSRTFKSRQDSSGQEERGQERRNFREKTKDSQSEGFEAKRSYNSPRKFSKPHESSENSDRRSTGNRYNAEKSRPEKDEGIRLNKYIASTGLCSRREADDLIQQGLITVNGKLIQELGFKISPHDEVRYNGERLREEKKVYVLLNKPKDYTTTTDDPHASRTVMDLVKNACRERIFPVGRLDRSTTGVLLLTNDGELAKKLSHPKHNKKKVYHIFLDKKLTHEDFRKIAQGIELEDGFIQPDALSWVDEEDRSQVGMEIHSGRNRIVRRIFESFGYKVKKLDRVYFAGLTKKGIERGHWRFLTEKEIKMLKMGAYE